MDPGLSKAEIEEGEKVWIKSIQTESGYHTSEVTRFSLKEKDGILRCVGKLGNSDLEIDVQEPVLLPKVSRLTKLVTEDCHAKVHHNGVRGTLAELRSKFWVPKGRPVVKKVLGKCVVFKRV